MHGFATIDYDDGKGSTYRGIELHIGKKIVRFDTGDPVVDFYDYIHGILDHKLEHVSCSSSFDHWFMDGAKCGKKKVVVLYFDSETHERVEKFDMIKFMRHEYIRIWALNGMKSMDDIKSYIKEKKGLDKKNKARKTK